ncbi:MAG: acylphosphatase [Endomicrobia bacterium]|nr:acylphosphatase [Endomicrobiia bacterium]
MNKIAFRLIVYGKVQGIGYRWFVKDVAKEENIYGYVKNKSDGSVEIVVESDDDEKIKKFIERIKKEHPYAFVEKIEISEIPVVSYKDFKIEF